jgi:Gram-negative bacterial TonB protein C-terminal
MRKLFSAIVLALIAPLKPLCAQRPPVLPPRLVSLPTPDCRSGKPCHGSHGEVRLIVDVLENGKAGDIRAELGDSVLVDAATLAVHQAEFTPGYFFGKPVLMNYIVTLRF